MVSIAMRIRGIPYIVWWQDVQSEAISSIAKQRLGGLGNIIGWIAICIERSCVRNAAAIVPITDAFVDCLDNWGTGRGKVTVIQNWGALEEITPQPRTNSWSKAHGFDAVPVVMYSGTLGLKHDPSLIAALSRSVPDHCRIVVVSQGMGRRWLEDHRNGDPRLVLLDYQPYEQVPTCMVAPIS